MKRDYYSDVRMTERIILESSLYVLSNLDKKVDSFTSQRTVYVMRQRERNELLHPDNILHCDPTRPLPALNQIANDLSRPLGTRISLLNPSALCKVPAHQSSSQKKQSNDFLKKIILRGLERFKNEHEDEGSLTLQLRRIVKCDCDQSELTKIEEFILELFQKFVVFTSRELNQSAEPRQAMKEIQFAYNLLGALIQRNQENQQLLRRDELIELITFIGTVDRQLRGCLQCKQGPVLINYWPEVQYLSLVVHPVLLTLYSCIRQQVKVQEKRFESNDNQGNQQSIKEDILFQQIGSHNCSRVTFINLDGHDSPLNLLLSKCLSKHVQYISFPLQCSKYFSKSMIIQDSPEFWSQEAKYFKVKQQCHKDHLQTYKRLLVFPLGFQQGPQFVDILPYASTFISFIMQEIVYNQIRDFNPTLIIISHSGRISLQSQDFESMIKQCSLITNMRVMLYNNLDYDVRSGNGISANLSMKSVEQGCWGLGVLDQLLYQTCMFLKISSGSVSLDRTNFQQTKQQKYAKFKILGYAYNLLRFISPYHPALQHLKNRFTQYRNRELLFNNFFHNHTLQPNQYSLYHTTLVNTVQAFFASPNSYPEFASLIAIITRKYGRHIQEHWRNFLLQYALAINTAQQKETVKYVVRFPHLCQVAHQQSYDLIALEFEIASEQGETAISISPDSQILISSARRGPVSSVFLLNHLPHHNHPTLVNYVGFIDSSIENSCEKRVTLKKVEFRQQEYQLGPHQHFCQFNFVETDKHVILFWPLLYDQRAALLHSFAKVKYNPPITSLIFIGSKANPTWLTSIQPINSSLITPRSGCTGYQPSNNETVIIFGGFYSGLKNYLEFQTDITIFQITSEQTILVENIPRSFYLTTREAASGHQVVTGIHNHFVRPRVEYQIYEKNRTKQFVEIILLGGIGQKYIRPYSMISHYAHQIMLHNDSIVSIKKIKLNNVVPANLKEPVRSKQETAALTICSAQNRRFTTEKKPSRPHSLCFLSFNFRYSSEEQRMLWSKNYEVGLIENRPQWESISLKDYDKQSIIELSYKGIHQSKVLISVEDSEGSRKLLLNLSYELDEQQAQQFVNLDVKIIPLSPENILAIDISGAIIYALIHHPMYTYGHPILVRSDFYTRQQLQQFQDNQHIPLRQIYCFDRKLNNHIIKVIEGDKIGILHGCHFNPKILFPEIILKKDKTGFFYCQEVEPSIISSQILMAAQEKTDFSSEVSKISFLYGHRGKFMCFSWLGLQSEASNVDQFLLLVDELPGQGEVLDWRLKFHGRLRLRFEENPISDLQSREIIDMVEQLGDQENRIYRFGVKYGDYMFRGSFVLDSLHDGDSVLMEIMKSQTAAMNEEQYKLQRLKQWKSVQYGQYIDKEPSCKFSSTEIDVEHT